MQESLALQESMPTPERVQEFIISLFENWTEDPYGRLGQCSVHFDKPCRDFFPADSYMCSLRIGLPIDEEFFGFHEKGPCFTWAMPDHSFRITDPQKNEAFYKKYPKEQRNTEKFTLRIFTEMVYDLIRISYGFMPLAR